MNLLELKNKIDDLIREIGDSDVHPSQVEVHVATQPSYPLRFDIDGLVTIGNRNGDGDGDGDGNNLVAYIVATDHPRNGSPYAPKECWDMI